MLLTKRARALPSSGVTDGDDAKRDREPDVVPTPAEGPMGERLEHVRQLAFQCGCPPEWAELFTLVARGESGGDTKRMLGIPTGAPPWAKGGGSSKVEKLEAKAACDVFATGKKHVGDCGWNPTDYCFGSGGLFAMLPMSGLKAFWSDPLLRCLHPWSVFDERIAMVMAYQFAWRLTQRAGYKGTVVSLRRGWGIPGDMGNIPPAKREKWGQHAQDIGHAPSWLDSKLPPLTKLSATTQFAAMMASPDWLPKPELYYERMVA